ncbi:MAG: alpha/beta fold hydrolase [Acidimicrobiales bacterium]
MSNNGPSSRVEMTPGSIRIDGRILRFAVSNNESPGESEQTWAINLHGFFAGGGMYWRESQELASRLGWRVINPSLPGFGGSDPLPWGSIGLDEIASDIGQLLDHLTVSPVVVLGHSMGGAVAIAFGRMFANRTLGIIYRDGAATPGWRNRRGWIPALIAPVMPDLAAPIDLLAAVALDVPDLLLGRSGSTIWSLVPDVRKNIRTLGRTIPVGSLLMTIDQREQIRELVARERIPILAEWGCFDRVAHRATALEFQEYAKTPVRWVPGGHSWMLARPRSQADLLCHIQWGREFVRQITSRALQLRSSSVA